jgi:very-short-patch-repair endonuclease
MDQRLIGLVVFLFVVIGLIKVLEQLVRGSSREFPYERTDKLFSAAERSFLGVLDQTFGNQYRILGKVRLGDIVQPRRGISKSARASAWNRISGKHVDFAVCDPRTLQVISVVELDDASHKNAAAQRGDQVKDRALAAAGIPIVRISARRNYNPQEIRETISQTLKGTQSAKG